MIILPELIERLRPPGRYLAVRYNEQENVEFYALMRLKENGKAIVVEEFFLDFEAEGAVDSCDIHGAANGPAYGPYCSTCSHIDNIERNERLIGQWSGAGQGTAAGLVCRRLLLSGAAV